MVCPEQRTVSQWRVVLGMSGGLQVVTFLFYLAFGSSVLQPWGRPDTASPGAVTITADTGKVSGFGSPPDTATDPFERRRQRRRTWSNPYASDGEIGRVRVYRSISPFASDTECVSGRSGKGLHRAEQPPAAARRNNGPVYYQNQTRTFTATNPLYHQTALTSESSENDYVTMDGSSASAADDEDIYESMNFDPTTELLPSGPLAKDQLGPVYENVRPTTSPPNGKACFSLTQDTSNSPSVDVNKDVELNERSDTESLTYGTFGRT